MYCRENIEKNFNRKDVVGFETETLDDQRYAGIFKINLQDNMLINIMKI